MTKRLFPLLYRGFLFFLLAMLPTFLAAQQVTLAGLQSQSSRGRFNAIRTDISGNLYLLWDQRDGVRVLKLNAAATQLLAQVQIGGAGDTGLGMALDPSGNVYVTGTSTGPLTGTSGAAFPARADGSTNSFVAKFNGSLTTQWISFLGGGRMAAAAVAATSDAVFVTGGVYAQTVPVTPDGIQQQPAPASNSNGFVERISSDGSTLVYATYLTGANGNTVPVTIAADSNDNAYIGGSTSATGYPTVNALIPQILLASGTETSGFLSRLTPAGDGFDFSTFIPGTGLTSLEVNGNALLVAGGIDPGRFPIMTADAPIVKLDYQAVFQMPLDGSTVSQSTLLAPGTQSFATPGSAGDLWAAGTLSTPLLPSLPLGEMGQSFLLHLTSNGSVDRAFRLGGLPVTSVRLASAPVTLSSLARGIGGNALAAGIFSPTTSSSLVSTQRYDLPLVSAPGTTLPSTVRDAAPLTSCGGSACSGSAGILVAATTSAQPQLAWSADGLPNLTLRNLGAADANALVLTASGYTLTSNCGATLSAGQSCTVLLTGSGPGSATASSSNAGTVTVSLPGNPLTGNPVAVSARELDFGIVTAASPANRTFTVTNLGSSTITASSALQVVSSSSPYQFAEQASTCPVQGSAATKVLAAGASCTITLRFTAAATEVNDGATQNAWNIGGNEILLTAYSQAAALAVSSTQIDFGMQYAGGLALPRYLYLSNSSATTQQHLAVALPANSPFRLTDRCPTELLPGTVCQIEVRYSAASAPSADSVTLSLDNGISVLLTGTTRPQPTVTGTIANPNLQLAPASVVFPDPVAVTAVSSTSQPVTVTNTGASAFPLQISLSGDFQSTTDCGANLAGGTSCSVVLSFAPTQPGTRTGLLAVTAGNFAPGYVSLSGTATAVLPANNGVLEFGSVPVGQPTVQWFKMAQSLTSLQVATTGDFAAIVVEDTGYGHGTPARTQFHQSTGGSCLNCWVGIQFQPTATGARSGSLSLSSTTSGGGTQTVTLAGNGIPLTGAVLTPIERDFGPVTVDSTSESATFVLTNAGNGASNPAITVSNPSASGDFGVSSSTPTGGTPCSGSLAYGESCLIAVNFTPSAEGLRSGALSITTSAGGVSSTLSGFGAPSTGIALTPDALVFENVAGTTSTQQSITLRNTSGATATFGSPTVSSTQFAVISTCSTLAPGGTCTLAVTFTPSGATTTAMLSLPVSFASALVPSATLTIALSGAYTQDETALQITPGEMLYPPATIGQQGSQRHFTLNNLTAKAFTVAVNPPRQFSLANNGCSGLAPAASCSFDLLFLPQTNGDVTGTVFVQATPSDNTAARSALGYVEGYALGSGSLLVGGTGAGGVLDFGQLPSGQSLRKTLPVTNTGAADLHLRRIRSDWPFLSTTTCGATLPPAGTCSITVTYTPLNQVPLTSPINYNQDQATLTIESDALSSPDLVDLSGQAQAVAVASPGNTAPLSTYALSTGSLSFPATKVGEVSLLQSLRLTNTGTQTVHITGLITPQDYTVANGCVGALLTGSSCRIDITYTPQTAITRPSALQIQSDATSSLEFVTLFATGTPASIAVTPTSLDFGQLNVGPTSTLPVQITNNGTGAVTINSIAAATADYTVAGNCPAAGSALAAGSTCTAQVSFTPTQTGPYTDTLQVATSATTLPLQVSLTGTGIQSRLLITPSSLGFGQITLGSSARQNIVLTNAGTGTVTSFAAVSSGADFAVVTPCADTLYPGNSCQMTVQFSPRSFGAQTASLRLTGSDPALPATIPLSGEGIAPGDSSHLTLAPSSLDFGSAAIGSSVQRTLLLANTGTAPLTALTVASQSADFTLGTSCPATLYPGDSCQLAVQFTPSTAGTVSSSLILTGSDAALPARVALSGTGTAGNTGSFSLSASAGTATVVSGKPASFTLTVTPQNGFAGNIALTCTPVQAGQYATCSLLPSSVSITGATTQTSVVTINTITSATSAQISNSSRLVWFALALPLSLMCCGRRRMAGLTLCVLLCVSPTGCGSSRVDVSLRYTPAGTYSYQVTATSTAGAPLSQTVTLNLTVTQR